MNKYEQQAAAKELFFLGWTMQRIRTSLKLHENTLTKWCKDGNWREERARRYSIDESVSSQLLELIDYQLQALRKHLEAHKDDDTPKLLDKGEIDALSKLFAAHKQKDIAWSQYVTITREIIQHIATKDAELSRQLVQYTDEFLIQKRGQIL